MRWRWKKEPEGGSIASVPALPGCINPGRRSREALINIREAVELYIEGLGTRMIRL